MTALLDLRYNLPGNPWTAYWEDIMGDLFPVFDNGPDPVWVQVGGWWPMIATALVAGCAVAARSVPATAHSSELVS